MSLNRHPGVFFNRPYPNSINLNVHFEPNTTTTIRLRLPNAFRGGDRIETVRVGTLVDILCALCNYLQFSNIIQGILHIACELSPRFIQSNKLLPNIITAFLFSSLVREQNVHCNSKRKPREM